MGSGYKKLYEATERENQALTELADAQGEMIERLKVMVEAQQELIKTLNKEVDELQEQIERKAVPDSLAGSEKS